MFNQVFDSSRFESARVKLPKIKTILTTLGIILLTILAVYLSSLFLLNSQVGSKSQANSSTTIKTDVAPPYSTKTINREFTFPLKNEKGNEAGKIKYTVESAELRDQIVINGQKADAIGGRTFLILNLKITNDNNQQVNFNSRDYLRLSLGNNDKEFLAPDIHNDPVEIQAIATKYTRLGLPINETERNFKLHIGEINGQKTVIAITL